MPGCIDWFLGHISGNISCAFTPELDIYFMIISLRPDCSSHHYHGKKMLSNNNAYCSGLVIV